jgi:hypothetical protein
MCTLVGLDSGIIEAEINLGASGISICPNPMFEIARDNMMRKNILFIITCQKCFLKISQK